MCGPMSVESLNGSKYFLLFTDDYFRMTWIFFIKFKSEVFSLFKKFKAQVELELGCKIKNFKTDNGREYLSVEFDEFLAVAGIKLQFTIFYSPQQNRTCERKNRTLLNMVRCLSFEKSMPKHFWAKAANTTIYLQHSLPTRALNSMIAYKALHNIKPSVSHLITFAEAHNSTHWKATMDEEVNIINKNSTWFLMERTDIMHVIGVKWIFRTKFNLDGSVNKYKARLVVKGCSQLTKVDFGETFALVARFETIKMLIALTTSLGWLILHLDIKLAFLNDFLQEDIYVDQLKGYEAKSQHNMVYKLHKALYGLKQAPRAWYIKIDSYLTSKVFMRSPNEPTLYVYKVDDQIQSYNESEFEMSGMGEMKYFLRFQLDQNANVNFPLVVNEKFAATNSPKLFDPSYYRSLVATRRILRYLKGTLDLGLYFKHVNDIKLIGFSISDWASSVENSKNTLSYACHLGNAMFSWNSKKQEVVEQSTIEAEYIAVAIATNQAIWLRKLLGDLNFDQNDATELFVDNKSIIAIVKNPINNGKTKHIKVKLHTIGEDEKNGDVKFSCCTSNMQVANIFTKALPKTRFEQLRSMLGVHKTSIREKC
ncbi:Cysteine-rich RLK (RECEPTOR-like protein kinase) 8 [Theobroma cacao]|uniref:Cysteine-rich RLK (RECEPTOR-like protein kinase) 8 n=1 Tax=Theobroma cacao TaxID=3641 RepID=A0A061F768_THECC|nr:Cysteine-rich RLK (RECEPTOR-like protein kinase) 8 [Theobroma cacao]